MNHFSRRRSLILAAVTIPLAGFCQPLYALTEQVNLTSVNEKLAELETLSGGRIGLSAINMENNARIQYRADERFPVTSTFKVLVVSAILKQSIIESHLLQQHVTYNAKDLVSWSPITEKHVAEGMSVFELCAATIQYSDNTAANLLMKLLGGPVAVTQFSRSIGDNIFRLDRWETELNSAIPGDVRDTTTPAMMEKSLRQLVVGNVLGVTQRELLRIWLQGNTTGNTSIRAGAPEDWIVGDKTGAGSYGTTNDIGVLWPPTRAPIVVAIYFTQHEENAPARKDVIASATRILISAII